MKKIVVISNDKIFINKNHLSTKYNDTINIIDDPHIKGGVRSLPFDGEGVATKKLNLVENGKLKSWLLNSQ